MNRKVIFALNVIFAFTLCGCETVISSEQTIESSTDDTSVESTPTGESGSLSNVSKITSESLIQSSLIKWEGRYEYKSGTSDIPNSVYLYNTATGFTVDFYGTELKTSFYHSGSNIYYDVKVDDETLPNVISRRFYLPDTEKLKTVTLVSGLKEGHHTVTCLKMDEPADAYTSVYQLQTDGSFYYRNQEEDNEKTKFMFICASGGDGFGALAYSEVSKTAISRTRANSSSLHAFNYLTARRFDADVQFVSQAGWGVRFPETKQISKVLDKCGITPNNNVSGALETSDWDYNNYVPDILIYNIGGNDTPNSAFDLDEYQSSVIEMVMKMHKYYPDCKMIWTHTASKAGGYAMSALESVGLTAYVKECIIPKVGAGETGSGTYGASSHNSFKSHLDAEHILVDFIKENYNLEPTVDDVTFSDFESIIDYGK